MQYGFNAFTKYFTHTSHYYVIYYNNFKPILYVHRLHKLIYWLRYVTYFTPINPLNFNFSSIRHTMYSHKLIGKFIQTNFISVYFSSAGILSNFVCAPQPQMHHVRKLISTENNIIKCWRANKRPRAILDCVNMQFKMGCLCGFKPFSLIIDVDTDNLNKKHS